MEWGIARAWKKRRNEVGEETKWEKEKRERKK